ncbi:MAG: hypothetical protein JSV84_04110 [Gemmatimonadota bacterium]|nr:MAG: hypothetical protein JSV84_04110 [Gemmatimonadota bacterium]
MKGKTLIPIPFWGKLVLLVTAGFTLFLFNNIWGQNALIVENADYFRGSIGNILTITMVNEGNVAGIMLDITFDPDCFSIDPESCSKTDRTIDMNIFAAVNPEPGLIRFTAASLGTFIPPGSGPIVRFTVGVSSECELGQYTFALSNSKFADPAGREYPHDVVNGIITVWPPTVLNVEDQVVFQNSRDNVINLNLDDESQDALICAAEVSILYDTTCFEVISVEPTNRTRDLNIFQYADRDSGIQIAMTGLGACILKGTGPIARINVNVSNCPEGFFSWNISNAKLADGGGNIIPFIEVDGNIAIYTSPKGNVNDDGTIDALDVVLTIRIAIGQYPDPSESELQAADCNLDGQVDVSDVIGIVNIITGLGICLPLN